ncbi:Acid-sensing ion channel 5 [Amphibalanus amphitrite]|uniref:Acid-sensing ion channel 5 n=1 Tax=Amphibalanus amphitrite TaxID=1232801 RepID=A0A6A4WA00_AMPAM|nr:Acid-sensing ion channel 5 [Amphibalanus amphitrite]
MTAAVLTPEERPSLCEVWRRAAAQFASDTNLAGVNNASRARHPLRRLVWCCLWLAGLVVSLNDVSLLVSDFLTYPVSTSYSIAYDSAVTFPAVTVCNQNSVMCTDLMQQLFAEPDDSLILDLVQRSACLSLIPGLCMPMKLMFFELGTLPSLLQNTSCFQLSSGICSELEEFGEQNSVNISAHLAELGCGSETPRDSAASSEPLAALKIGNGSAHGSEESSKLRQKRSIQRRWWNELVAQVTGAL